MGRANSEIFAEYNMPTIEYNMNHITPKVDVLMVRAMDSRLKGRGFDSATLGKLFAHMCLCYLAV